MKTSTTSCPIREGDLVGKRARESICARERSYTGATDDLIPLRERRRAPGPRMEGCRNASLWWSCYCQAAVTEEADPSESVPAWRGLRAGLAR